LFESVYHSITISQVLRSRIAPTDMASDPPHDRLKPDDLMHDPALLIDAETVKQRINRAFPPSAAPDTDQETQPLILPASRDLMDSLLESFDESELDSVEQSERFRQVSPDELREIIDWIRANPRLTDRQMICVARGEKDADDSLPQDITISPTTIPSSQPRSLEESWVLMDAHDPYASLFVQQQGDSLQRKRSFFHHWPSFSMSSKMSWVLSATGTAFFFGYLTGAKAALDSLYRLASRPFLAVGAAGVTVFASAFAPEIALSTLKYIIIGGLFGGAAVATPVFVIGTGGVFVAAAVYHSFETTKRLGKLAAGSNK